MQWSFLEHNSGFCWSVLYTFNVFWRARLYLPQGSFCRMLPRCCQLAGKLGYPPPQAKTLRRIRGLNILPCFLVSEGEFFATKPSFHTYIQDLYVFVIKITIITIIMIIKTILIIISNFPVIRAKRRFDVQKIGPSCRIGLVFRPNHNFLHLGKPGLPSLPGLPACCQLLKNGIVYHKSRFTRFAKFTRFSRFSRFT